MRKLVSLVLTFVMVLSLAVPGLAATEENQDRNPLIIVRGISIMGLAHANGTPALKLDAEDMTKLLFETLLTRLSLRSEDALYESIAEVVKSVAAPIACDKNGNPVGDVTMKQYTKAMSEYPNHGYYDYTEGGILKSAAERYGTENLYWFTFDWRLSAKTLATQLDALIKTAKADSGKDKVDIICASMGCMITNAYFHFFNGYDNVERAIYLSGAHNGVYACADSLSGNITMKTETLKELIVGIFDGSYFARFLLGIYDYIGALDFLCEKVNELLDKYYYRATEDFLRDTLGTMPGIWALCTPDRYDQAVETVFSGCEQEYAGLLEVLDETGEFIKRSEDILLTAKDKGIELCFVSNYNKPGIPVIENGMLNGDGTIEAVNSSNGATVAYYGKTLSEEYIASADSRYISADKVIDASTALFKDSTWFVKDAKHVAGDYGTEYNDFIFWLLECEGQPTVTSNKEYPQFMIADSALNLEPLK